MKKHSVITVLMLIFLFSIACEREDLTNDDLSIASNDRTEGMMVLGDKLMNPYSVANMKKAAENLKGDGIDVDFNIETTHLYIRFLPKDSDELNWFIDNDSMEMFDYPLDYEIIEGGQFYQDPSIPFGKPTWLYTSVPIGYKMPDIQSEVLEMCYIPGSDGESLKSNKIPKDILALLELEAFQITGNLNQGLKSSEAVMASNSPKGTFRIHNTAEGGLTGIEGVKVRVNNFVKWDVAFTDGEGKYEMSKSFRTNVYYSIIYENVQGYKIWGDRAFLAPAKYEMGYKSSSGFSKDFWQSSIGWKWALVNNAVRDYLSYCDSRSIIRPPSDLRVWVFARDNNTSSGSASMLRRTWGTFNLSNVDQLEQLWFEFGLLDLTTTLLADLLFFVEPDITIAADFGAGASWSQYITELVYHECSHASHWSLAGTEYWVMYINYILDYGAYGNGTGTNAWVCGLGEMWANYFGYKVCTDLRYTASNIRWNPTRDWFNPGFMEDVDAVSGISTNEIFNSLSGDILTIEEFITKIKLYTSYDSQIDAAYNKSAYSDWP